MPEGDRAAVDVGALPVELADRAARRVLRVPRGRREDPRAGEHLRGERLVDLDQADVLPVERRPSSGRAASRRPGPRPMRSGSRRAERKAADLRPAASIPRTSRAAALMMRAAAAAVGDLRGVARRHGPEPAVEERASASRGPPASGSPARRCPASPCLRTSAGSAPARSPRRASRARDRRALVRAQREGVLLLPRDAVLLGEHFGRLAHVQPAHGVGQPHLQADLRLEVPRPELRRRRHPPADGPARRRPR